MPIDTKSIIADKFIELSATKSINQISVKELVQGCGISRQAFYYHFQDILEVAAYANEMQVRRILASTSEKDDLATAIGIFISFYAENMTTTRIQLESQKYRKFEQLLTQMIRLYLTELLKKSNKMLTAYEIQIALDLYSGGIYTLLVTYAGKSKAEDSRLAALIAEILRGNKTPF